jgi:hypothetical protein
MMMWRGKKYVIGAILFVVIGTVIAHLGDNSKNELIVANVMYLIGFGLAMYGGKLYAV